MRVISRELKYLQGLSWNLRSLVNERTISWWAHGVHWSNISITFWKFIIIISNFKFVLNVCVFPVIWCSQLTASKSRDDHVPACQKLVGWNPAVLTMVAPRPSGPVVGCFGIVSLFTVHSFRVQTRSTISPLIECESSLSQQTQARECGCVALIYHAFSNPSRYFRQRGQLTIFAFNKRTHLYNWMIFDRYKLYLSKIINYIEQKVIRCQFYVNENIAQ